MIIKFIKLKPTSVKPKAMTLGSSGFDLFSCEKKIIPPSRIIYKNKVQIGHDIIRTGIKLEIPVGYIGRIGSRSGLSVNDNIGIGAGWIDSDYRGEILVELKNLDPKPYIVNIGDRIAQLFIIKSGRVKFIQSKKLSRTRRGLGGVGSTGK